MKEYRLETWTYGVSIKGHDIQGLTSLPDQWCSYWQSLPGQKQP